MTPVANSAASPVAGQTTLAADTGLMWQAQDILSSFRQANTQYLQAQSQFGERFTSEAAALQAWSDGEGAAAKANHEAAVRDAAAQLERDQVAAQRTAESFRTGADDAITQTQQRLELARGRLAAARLDRAMRPPRSAPPALTPIDDPCSMLERIAAEAATAAEGVDACLAQIVRSRAADAVLRRQVRNATLVLLVITIVLVGVTLPLLIIALAVLLLLFLKKWLVDGDVFEPKVVTDLGTAFARLTQAAATIGASHAGCVELRDQERRRATEAAEALNSRAVASSLARYLKALGQLTQDREERAAALEARRLQTLEDIERDHSSAMAGIHSRVAALTNGTLSSSWDDPSWTTWEPRPNGSPQPFPRVGQFVENGAGHEIVLPACALLENGRALMIKCKGSARHIATRAAQSLLLRLLTTLPAGRLRLSLVDPVRQGQNVEPFMHLREYGSILVGSRAWTEDIEQCLAELNSHVDTVIQHHFRGDYENVEAYNASSPDLPLPYWILAMLDFPASVTGEAALRLSRLIENGPRCGVHTILVVDTDQPVPHGVDMTRLERLSTVIDWKDDRFVWENQDQFRTASLQLDEPPNPTQFREIIRRVGAANTTAGRVATPFERVAPAAPEQWWTGSSLDGLTVSIGGAGASSLQLLELGKGTAQHALVAGKTGSGKSNLLHVIITNLALNYSPEELQLYLVDLKEGVEFKSYATHHLPHAPVVAIEGEPEFGLSVLEALVAEKERRGDLFGGARDIAQYRRTTGQPLARILLVIDEFHRLFSENDPTSIRAARALEEVIKEGRAFGIHAILSSQTLAGAYAYTGLTRGTLDQIAVRIALPCSEADSRHILGEENPAAEELSQPGDAIYNADRGLAQFNSRFRVALLPHEQHDGYLQQLHDLARRRRYQPPQPQVVFEGGAPASLELNEDLSKVVEAPAWPATPRLYRAWLGEPVAIRPPIAASFQRQTGANLLILGPDDAAALGMMAAALIGLAAQVPPGAAPAADLGRGNAAPVGTQFYVVDLRAEDEPYTDCFEALLAQLPHKVRFGRQRELPEFVEQISTEVQRRIDEEDVNAPPLFFLLHALQRARALRQEDPFAMPRSLSGGQAEHPSPARQFSTVLREGAALGVHTLTWCDTLANLSRAADSRAQREVFGLRALLQMSADANLPLAVSTLKPNRALFVDDDAVVQEKFRPYTLTPERRAEWERLLASASAYLRAKTLSGGDR
jgi:hypothetical protein